MPAKKLQKSLETNRRKSKARTPPKPTGVQLLAALELEVGAIAVWFKDVNRWFCYHKYLHAFGQRFVGRRPCSDHAGIEDYYRRGRFEIRQCYANCQRWIIDQMCGGGPEGLEVRYFEGWFLDHLGIAIHHGWLVNGTGPNSRVIDPTLDVLLGRNADVLGQVAYLGVHVPSTVVRRNAISTRVWGVCSEGIVRDAVKNNPNIFDG